MKKYLKFFPVNTNNGEMSKPMQDNPLAKHLMNMILFAREFSREVPPSPADCVPRLKLLESTSTDIIGTTQTKVDISYSGQIPYDFTLQIQRRQRRPIPYFLPTAIVEGKIGVNNQTNKTQLHAKIRFALPGFAFVITCTILILILTGLYAQETPWFVFIAVVVTGIIWMQLIRDYSRARQKTLHAFGFW